MDTDKAIKRRGIFAAVGAVAAMLTKQATAPVEAAYNLQGDTSNSASSTTSIGPFTILSNAPVLQVANGFTTGFTATADAIQAAAVANSAVAVRGLHFDAGDGLDGHSPHGVGVRGHSSGGYAVVGNPGTGIGVYADTVGTNQTAIWGVGFSNGSVGVRGTISSSPAANSIAVHAENESSASGGYGCFGYSAKGHGVVGATGSANVAAVAGSTNGVSGVYAGIFYGSFVVVGGPEKRGRPDAGRHAPAALLRGGLRILVRRLRRGRTDERDRRGSDRSGVRSRRRPQRVSRVPDRARRFPDAHQRTASRSITVQQTTGTGSEECGRSAGGWWRSGKTSRRRGWQSSPCRPSRNVRTGLLRRRQDCMRQCCNIQLSLLHSGQPLGIGE